MAYLGIDPGTSGGFALVSERGALLSVLAMPATPEDITRAIQTVSKIYEQTFAMIERVWATPIMGSKSSFAFGRNVGRIESALIACGIPYDEVLPQLWQQSMGCRVGRSSASSSTGRGGDKNITKRRAQALFPAKSRPGGVDITHATADAILIAEFARRRGR